MMNLTPSIVRGAALSLAALLCLTSVGCGGSDRSYVTGIVTLDGVPVPNCSLQFTPLQPGPGGGGNSDATGRYEGFMSRSNDWLTPGEYRVEIWTSADVLITQSESPDLVKADAVRIPSRYQGPDSELRMTLEPGANRVDFALTR